MRLHLSKFMILCSKRFFLNIFIMSMPTLCVQGESLIERTNPYLSCNVFDIFVIFVDKDE